MCLKSIIIKDAYPNGNNLLLPYIYIKGNKADKKIAIIGTQHGDEFFSVSIINHFLKKSGHIGKAELYIFFLANPVAFNENIRRNPIDGKDMNRCWPGKKSGTITQIICYNIFQIIKNCDYVLDLHNGNKNIRDWPQVRVHKHNRQKTEKLCKYLGIDFFINHKEIRNTLVEAMHKINKIAICVEIGEGKRIDSFYLNKGVEIIEKFIKFACENPKISEKATHIKEENIKKIYSSNNGIFIPNDKRLGKKSNLLGNFIDTINLKEKQIKLKKQHRFLSINVGGIVNKGQLLARVVE
ncbi:MAG: hypothetical protein B6U87_02190 [Candidatus Aenigmarchaeota archaeon ex4484_52]|nr:MAG: hypothetical protein B6U87_02190 [Candidatus Aenigmarchaeota archaeon ex4484_52]